MVVSQAYQPNVTSLGILDALYASGNISTDSYFVGGGNAFSNLQSSQLVGNVANANVAMVVSQAYQPNITSVGLLSNLAVSNAVTTGNLVVTSNILPGDSFGNTYLTGNLVISGNVYTELGNPLGFGGSLYFSLGGIYAVSAYTGDLYGPTLAPILSYFSVQGTSSAVSVTAGGYMKFSRVGVYNFRGVFCTNGDNITGVAIGSNAAEARGTAQNYIYRIVPFLTQNPTAVFDFDFYVNSTTNYYFVDLFAIDTPILQATTNPAGGTWFTVGPSASGGGAGGTLTISTLGSCILNTSPGPSDYYIGVNNGMTVTLPFGASLSPGKQYIIKDESGLAGTFVGSRVTVAASGSDLIDGRSSFVIAINYGSINVIWTGLRWSIF